VVLLDGPVVSSSDIKANRTGCHTKWFAFSLYVVLVRDTLDLTTELPVMCTRDLITRSVSLFLCVVLVRDVLDTTPELPVTRIRTFLYRSEFSSLIISLPLISCYM
jgi:hypothetical protein